MESRNTLSSWSSDPRSVTVELSHKDETHQSFAFPGSSGCRTTQQPQPLFTPIRSVRNKELEVPELLVATPVPADLLFNAHTLRK